MQTYKFTGLKRSFKTSSKRHDTRIIESAEEGVSVSEFFEFYLKNKVFRFMRGNVEFEGVTVTVSFEKYSSVLQFHFD